MHYTLPDTREVLRHQNRLGGKHIMQNLLDWYYDISMPKCVSKQLTRYAQPPPRRPQHCPYEPNLVHYSKQSDDIIHVAESPLFSKTEE